MDISAIKPRVDKLLSSCDLNDWSLAHQAEVYQGTVGILQILYGKGSSQEGDLRALVETIGGKVPHDDYRIMKCIGAVKGTLVSITADLDAGLVGSLARIVAGDVLTDFVKLSRAVLETPSDEAKNVGAVLAAAAFEDTIRRLGILSNIPEEEKLADVVVKLKEAGILQGAQVGIAQSYLNFRNRALHADWSGVDRPEVQSVLAFTEQLILQKIGQL